MATESNLIKGEASAQTRPGEWRHFVRIFFGRGVVVFGVVVIVIFILTAIFAPLVAYLGKIGRVFGMKSAGCSEQTGHPLAAPD